MSDSPKGVIHRHEDGREHRHFSAGFEIGGQVRPDHDGTEEHTHGTLSLTGDGYRENVSGPVVWRESAARCPQCDTWTDEDGHCHNPDCSAPGTTTSVVA